MLFFIVSVSDRLSGRVMNCFSVREAERKRERGRGREAPCFSELPSVIQARGEIKRWSV